MNNKKLLFYFFISFPFLDVITSLLIRFYDLIITPGLIVKGFFMLIMIFYVLLSKSKYKKISCALILSFLTYMFLYFIFKPELINSMFFFNEVNYLLKLLYFPIIFLGLLCFYDEYQLNKAEIHKIIKYNLISMTVLLVVPLIFNNAFPTYLNNYKGFIGWFYAGNEVACIMVILFPFIYNFISLKYKYHFLIFLPITYVTLCIGTKVALIGVIIIAIINLIYSIFKESKFLSYKYFINLLILLTIIFFAYNSYAVDNYKSGVKNNADAAIIIDETEKEEVNKILYNLDSFYNYSKYSAIVKTLFSGRNIYLANTLSIYNNQDNSNVWLGIGFSNTEMINNTNIAKMIEIDVLDAFFHYGILGLLIMLSPILLVIYLLLKKQSKITTDSVYYTFILLLVFGISCLSGHVFTAPAVSFYIVLYILLILNEFKLINNRKSLKDKISIISYHLGYGGIERSIVNQANMISEKYKVEIVSLYKVVNKIPYKLNKKVKIIYLSDLKPNKEIFLNYLYKFNLIMVLVEGMKSIYILYMKRKLLNKYIINSDSKILISTRIEITKKLSIYGNNDCIKIAEEHVYHHENLKYFKKLKESLKNIDYLLPASQYLTNDYKRILKDEPVRIVYIPSIVSDVPKSLNKLNNYNVLAVGRLSREKGFTDLIDIFKLVNDKNKKIKLILVGDGSDKQKIKQKIKYYKLNKNILLTGYLNQERLKKEYSKASLFVMTSFEESFGIVLIEAMSYGIPCLAFDSALGAKEIINGKNGKLIKNRDNKKMAEEIINYFSTNKIKMSIEAKKISEYYTFNQIKIKWENLIEEIFN